MTRCPGALLFAAVLSGCALLGAGVAAQNTRFKSGVDLVTVTATVVDADGHPVADLPVSAFDLFEDGDRQPITQFTNERVPISLAVLLDVSDSMFGQRLADARAAVEQFLFDLLQPEDEFTVFAFNHESRPLTPWTQSPELLRKAFDQLRPFGSTAIYDALLSAMPMMASRSRERAGIVIISDGEDTASDASLRDVRMALLQSDAFVYAIAVDPPPQRAINRAVNVSSLTQITTGSGGHTEIVHATADLQNATAIIATELNSQYLLGFSSSRSPDGRFHSIRVRTKDGKFRVRARNGYIASTRNRSR